MEVVVAMNEFRFDSNILTSPYVSAPSSPKQFRDPAFNYYDHYSSAPTSPRLAQVFASTLVPFDWEERPGTPPKSIKFRDSIGGTGSDDEDDNFAFEFSGQLEKGKQPTAAADELFEEGMIRPLKPPPRLYNLSYDANSVTSSPRSPPKSPNRRTLWSPRKREDDFDPFTAAMVEATRERGRERGKLANSKTSSSNQQGRKASRSLSPMRGGVGGFFRTKEQSSNSNTSASTTTSVVAAENMKSSGGSRKWRLRDLLLFRSASEGRATGNRNKDPLNKYTVVLSSSSSNFSVTKGGNIDSKRREDLSNSSFRSTDSSGSTRKGRGATVSAHEKHYISNRAMSGELKKKTPLPYRQGLFGFLRFNQAVNNIARGSAT